VGVLRGLLRRGDAVDGRGRRRDPEREHRVRQRQDLDQLAVRDLADRRVPRDVRAHGDGRARRPRGAAGLRASHRGVLLHRADRQVAAAGRPLRRRAPRAGAGVREHGARRVRRNAAAQPRSRTARTDAPRCVRHPLLHGAAAQSRLDRRTVLLRGGAVASHASGVSRQRDPARRLPRLAGPAARHRQQAPRVHDRSVRRGRHGARHRVLEHRRAEYPAGSVRRLPAVEPPAVDRRRRAGDGVLPLPLPFCLSRGPRTQGQGRCRRGRSGTRGAARGAPRGAGPRARARAAAAHGVALPARHRAQRVLRRVRARRRAVPDRHEHHARQHLRHRDVARDLPDGRAHVGHVRGVHARDHHVLRRRARVARARASLRPDHRRAARADVAAALRQAAGIDGRAGDPRMRAAAVRRRDPDRQGLSPLRDRPVPPRPLRDRARVVLAGVRARDRGAVDRDAQVSRSLHHDRVLPRDRVRHAARPGAQPLQVRRHHRVHVLGHERVRPFHAAFARVPGVLRLVGPVVRGSGLSVLDARHRARLAGATRAGACPADDAGRRHGDRRARPDGLVRRLDLLQHQRAQPVRDGVRSRAAAGRLREAVQGARERARADDHRRGARRRHLPVRAARAHARSFRPRQSQRGRDPRRAPLLRARRQCRRPPARVRHPRAAHEGRPAHRRAQLPARPRDGGWSQRPPRFRRRGAHARLHQLRLEYHGRLQRHVRQRPLRAPGDRLQRSRRARDGSRPAQVRPRPQGAHALPRGSRRTAAQLHQPRRRLRDVHGRSHDRRRPVGHRTGLSAA